MIGRVRRHENDYGIVVCLGQSYYDDYLYYAKGLGSKEKERIKYPIDFSHTSDITIFERTYTLFLNKG